MDKKTFEVYTLKKVELPLIKKNKVINGHKYGGEKLTYIRQVITYGYLIFKIRKYNIKFRIILTKSGKRDVVFLRPLKINWDTSTERLPAILWGKSNRPLTNIWVRTSRSYTDINKEKDVYFSEKIKNHKVIRLLKSHTPKFMNPLVSY